MLKKTGFPEMLLLFFLSLGCNKKSAPSPNPCYYNGADTCLANAPLKLTIDLTVEKQTIHSFGASDCWSAKFIGKWADINKKNQVADYLFSTDTLPDGSPRGIGLSLWRFNIGAGSYEQGAASGIPDEWRREECFLQPDGSYDWNKQAGQQWFLSAAKSRNVKYTLGFAVSAPVSITKDGRAHGSGGNSFNIATGKMTDYARFLTAVAGHFKFDYISPFNEPQWNWGSGSPSQEGSAATNTEISTLVKMLGPQMAAGGIASKIVVGEAAQLNFFTDPYDNYRGDQLNDWFNAGSGNYIGTTPQVEQVVSGHGYFTTCPDNNLISLRKALWDKKNQVNPALNIWQTEFGILGDICGKYNGYPRNTSIDYGLYVAKIIHHDLVFAQVSSWQWWLAMGPYDYSDALVCISDPNGSVNPDNSKTSGVVSDSKQLWCMGNFSRFIRPGMKRVIAAMNGMDEITAAGSLMVSAYKDAGTKNIVIVIVNTSNSSRKIILDGAISAAAIKGNRFDTYTTTASKSLGRATTAADNIMVEAMSVTTFAGYYN